LLVVCGLVAPGRGDEQVIDSPMYRNPELPMAPEQIAFPNVIPLWQKALERPDAELQERAAAAVARAQRQGMKGLEALIPALIQALEAPNQHPSVRLAAAEALITLDAHAAASNLFQQTQPGPIELLMMVEPALARWNYEPARAVWLTRLQEPKPVQRTLILAIQGLGTVRENKAEPKLLDLVLADRTAAMVRLEAARALAILRHEGLEEYAARLATEQVPARLLAVTLLQQHGSTAAVAILQRLLRDPEPAVASRAATRLLQIDSKLLVPTVEHLLIQDDATLRSAGIEVLRRESVARRLPQLAKRLDDPHPEVRTKARLVLHELATSKNLRSEVITEATHVLTTQQWRGLEQAAILLVQLQHQPAVPRLQELLEFDRPEVFLTAAWGLRRLDVPAALPVATDFLKRWLPRILINPVDDPDVVHMRDLQLAQLLQWLGQRRYRQAEAFLREFVPKRAGAYPEARAGGIWALGLIHEGRLDAGLAAQFQARLVDDGVPPEEPRIRTMSAIALGRMSAQSTIPSLRRYCPNRKPSRSPIANACGWALVQLTGEPMLPATPAIKMLGDWFLRPLE
jgi:HEAT repeat protein